MVARPESAVTQSTLRALGKCPARRGTYPVPPIELPERVTSLPGIHFPPPESMDFTTCTPPRHMGATFRHCATSERANHVGRWRARREVRALVLRGPGSQRGRWRTRREVRAPTLRSPDTGAGAGGHVGKRGHLRCEVRTPGREVAYASGSANTRVRSPGIRRTRARRTTPPALPQGAQFHSAPHASPRA